MSRRRFVQAGVDCARAAGLLSLGSALVPSLGLRAQPASGIATTDLGEGLVVLQGAGCNVTALPGDDGGALMIDGGLAANADALIAAVRDATGSERIGTLVNTHWHPEQTGANVAVGRAGGVIFAHENTRLYVSHKTYAMTDAGTLEPIEPLPEEGRPTQTTRGDGTLDFAGRQIEFGYLPQAHTDGDLYLHFPDLDVLVAGGVVSGERWPLLEYRNGAWFGGRVRALQWLAEVVGPDTTVVPAQGPLITGRDVRRQREIYDELFETLIEYMNRGFGAEDAVASNPLAEYEDRYGDPAAFLDGAYRSMLIAYVPD